MKVSTRDQLVDQARSVPKNVYGIASIVGYAAAIGGLALLIVSVLGVDAATSIPLDWRIAVAVMIAGAALMWSAAGILKRRFDRAVLAAGFTAEQIREIEDEAERLNEEED